MPKVRLARDQSITVDGIVLLGTRDFELDQELDGVDVTPWQATGAAELTLVESATLTLQVYYVEALQRLTAKWNAFPPEPVEVAIPYVGAGKFIVRNIKYAGPFAGVLAYTVTLKSWPYA